MIDRTAVEERELKARQLGPGVVGVPMRMDLVPTLELALRLHPGTRRVVVVTGTGDQRIRQIAVSNTVPELKLCSNLWPFS